MTTTKKVRVVTHGPSTPVRIVVNGPSDPVEVITSGPSDPVRIVTRGTSDPVRGLVVGPPVGYLLTMTITTTMAEIAQIYEMAVAVGETVYIDWGDGTVDAFTGDTSPINHTYGAAGTWSVVISNASQITILDLEDQKITFAVSAANPIPAGMLRLVLYDLPGLTWDVSTTVPMPAGLTLLVLFTLPGFSWTVSPTNPMPAGMQVLIMTALPGFVWTVGASAPVPTGITFMGYYNTLNQSSVDNILEQIWIAKAGFTDAAPSLDILASNSAPSGIYQAASPPTTGEEFAYDLVFGAYEPDGPEWIVSTH